MSYFQAILLGLVQGLAEFLPISSSGHLSLLQHFFGVETDKVLLFTVLMHVGTLVSVFIVYRSDIWALIKELFAVFKDIFTGKGLRINANDTRRLGFMIIVATIPTAIIGFLFEDFFNGLYLSILPIGIGLIFTGTILFLSEKMVKGIKDIENMSFKTAIFVGVMQGIAICPGVSRSGSTLVGGLAGGLNRKLAVRFAFLISIPSILGSVVLELPKAVEAGADPSLIGPIIAGVTVAALSGLAAIKLMIRLVQNKKLLYFSIYTWTLGATILLYSIFA